MSGTQDERIQRLEETVAHQTETIDDMSRQLAEQWKFIDRMKRLLEEMGDRFEALEDQTRANKPTQKPPHW